MGTEPKRILVIQTAFLGDVVLTTPLLSALRDRFPTAYLAALVIPGTREVLSGLPILDDVFVYDKKGRDRGLKGLRSVARSLKAKRFDVCLLPHRSLRSALVAFLAGIPERIGFVQSPGSFFYARRVRRDGSRHEVRRNLELIKPLAPDLSLDAVASTTRLWAAFADEDRDWANHCLAEHGLGKSDRIVAVAPGSVWATKRWLPEGFAGVIDDLASRYDRKIVLVGSRDDVPVTERVMTHCRRKPVNLAGKTTLRQLAAVLKRCDVLITNDNGAMHVGVAQGIPIVAVFGSTTLGLGYGPFTERAIVVEKDLSCRPCGKHGHAACPLDHFNCMRQITAEEVLTAATKCMETVPPS